MVTEQKEQIITEMVNILKQMDMRSLLYTKSNVEILGAKEKLDKMEASKERKSS